MILRTATQDDVKDIARIMSDWFANTPYMPTLHSRNEDRRFIGNVVKNQDVMLATDDQIVQGFIAREVGEINQLYLDPAARGKGIGKALLDCMKDRTPQLSLWCFQANTGARRFYERNRFVAVKFTNGEKNDECLPDIRFIWGAL